MAARRNEGGSGHGKGGRTRGDMPIPEQAGDSGVCIYCPAHVLLCRFLGVSWSAYGPDGDARALVARSAQQLAAE